jgi:hypothetical protein
MFDLPGRAHNGAFAVAFDTARITAQRLQKAGSHAVTQGAQVIHEWLDVGDVPSGKGVLDHRQHRPAAQWYWRRVTAFMEHLFDLNQHFA